MRKLPIVIVSALLLVAAIASAQSGPGVRTTSIVALEQTSDVRFIEVEGEVYLNWIDLFRALPGFFMVNDQGQIQLTESLISLLVLGAAASTQGTSPSSSTSDVIESRIDGEFEGWDGESLFRLQNGQIWQQAEYDYHYSYRYSPRVTIVRTDRGWVMSVDGVSKTLRVERVH